MEQNEWVLPLRDGTVVKIPANKVSLINKKIQNKEPISIADRLILYQDIASGPRLYAPEPIEPEILEQAAAAFGDPLLDNEGNVRCVWVKQTVTSNQWNKYYSQFASYHKLGNAYDSVVVAYRLPEHLAVDNSLDRCNPTEVQTLETKLANS